MPKKIILCFDGTKENFGPQPFSNVLKIYRLLNQANPDQLCYYQPGIGTQADFDFVEDIRRRFTISTLKNVLDATFAFSITDHIVSAYLYLMKHYEQGDSIYMFGFSRGAFIARVLAGMLERVGLLNVGLEDMVKMAWRIYESWEFAEQPSQPNYTSTLIEEFRKIFCRDYEIKIFFQGLFDSVNSVGILRDRLFPCTQRSNIVDHVRHALSIDERRGKFKQFCFTPNPYAPQLFSLTYKAYELESFPREILQEWTSSSSSSSATTNDRLYNSAFLIENSEFQMSPKSVRSEPTYQHERQKPNLSIWNAVFRKKSDNNSNLIIGEINEYLTTKTHRKIAVCSHTSIEGTFRVQPASLKSLGSTSNDLIEKWFPGDHSDVGGGWAPDCEAKQSVSDISLRWIIAESVKHGVEFKRGIIHDFDKRHSSLGALFASTHDYLKVDENHDIDSIGRVIGEKNANLECQLLKLIEANNSKDASQEIDIDYRCGQLNRFMSYIWWLLEFLPIGIRIENKEGKWRNVYVPNFGRPRYIPQYGDMHWSVYWRIKYIDQYRPNNLPRYVRKLIDQFFHVKLRQASCNVTTTKIQTKNEDVLPYFHNSLRTINEYSNMCSPNEYTYDAVIELKFHQQQSNILLWEKSGWSEVPDDLAHLLAANPDL
ncbi:hypothetical protein KAFR_0E00630 [Kazachstania africana CBS 2517]|uniref:T6SS Phospholipase effector Tle1-like catalytic domain-containing protein n=1 Tax=Kazachstania africana (strain ATCC 22294 / BCRC 22015 / CBS 2517 / CECT 1963 / NBRC 1671 / NRRL Y-8276) TaxID=1071382 RepID=H2AV17_KAZAF|nr:hypothetical protein KAFR_0E00630 [Kazachstania africana CBS 2517]CCF58217.1 hypothetical protein KAFR_0E00630 [Kazachstania africana CBS 2517]